MSTPSSDETWEWDGATWILRTPSTKPLPLLHHGFAFDASRGVTVLFGGIVVGASGGSVRGETWEWDGVNWTERLFAVSPPPRRSFAFAFDSARDVCVLFGGVDGSNTIMNDTWLYDGAQWSQALAGASAPSPRCWQAAAFDEARGRVVLFGGFDGQLLCGDTWEWDGAMWIPIAPATSPSPRLSPSLAYDSVLGRTILCGGGTTAGPLPADTWVWDGTTWSQLSTSLSNPRSFAGMAYDRAHGATLLFGGWNWSVLDDTWKLPSSGASGVSGHVRFPDGITSVASPTGPVSIQVYTHPGHELVPGATASVNPADGSYSVLPGQLGPGEYDVVAVAAVPGGNGQLWHQGAGYASIVHQPWDLDPAADLVVGASGVAIPTTLDFTFPWPVILVHGLTPLCFTSGYCSSGVDQFTTLQPYLAEDISTALTNPRAAVMPLVPKLRFKAWPDCYTIFRAQVPRIRKFFPTSTRFQLAGYSQGGLVARKLVWDTGGAPWIEKVVQIATPNDGSCVADWACALAGGSPCYLTVGYMGSTNAWLNDGFGVPFHLVAGTRYEPRFTPDNTCLASVVNGSDSIVPVDSVNAIRLLNYNVIGPTLLVNATHEGLLVDPAALAAVQGWLGQ